MAYHPDSQVALASARSPLAVTTPMTATNDYCAEAVVTRNCLPATALGKIST